MTWSEFNSLVRVHLVAHNRRQGIQTLVDTLIKASAWDLQASVPSYVAPVRRVFPATALRVRGYAAGGSLPVGARVLHVYLEDPATKDQTPLSVVSDTGQLVAMESGATGAKETLFLYNPGAGAFFVSPSPRDNGAQVVVTFQSKLTNFENDDEVPFDEPAAEAVGHFVNARLALQVDKDLAAAQMYAGAYAVLKRKLHSERNAALLNPESA